MEILKILDFQNGFIYTCFINIMAEEISGILGLVILLLSWLSEAYQTVKEHKAKIPITFACLYLIASALLSYHAFLINDTIFLVLNLFTGLIALMNIYYFLTGDKAIGKLK